MNVSLGEFGKTERTCVRMGSAKVLITVILPTYDNSLWIHEFNTDLTFFKFCMEIVNNLIWSTEVEFNTQDFKFSGVVPK